MLYRLSVINIFLMVRSDFKDVFSLLFQYLAIRSNPKLVWLFYRTFMRHPFIKIPVSVRIFPFILALWFLADNTLSVNVLYLMLVRFLIHVIIVRHHHILGTVIILIFHLLLLSILELVVDVMGIVLVETVVGDFLQNIDKALIFVLELFHFAHQLVVYLPILMIIVIELGKIICSI